MTEDLAFSPASYPYDPGLGHLVEAFVADRDALARRYPLSKSALRLDRMDAFLQEWQAHLASLPLDRLTPPARLDRALFDNHLRRSLRALERERREADRLAGLFPWGQAVARLDAARMAMETPDPAGAAEALDRLARDMAATEPIQGDAPAAAWRDELRAAMERWRTFHAGYDPALDWWARVPLEAVTREFERLTQPAEEGGAIPGVPVGRAALEEDLAFDLVPYSPRNWSPSASASTPGAWRRCSGRRARWATAKAGGRPWRR